MASDFALGKPFPNLSMTDRDGHTVTLSQLTGSWLVLFTLSRHDEGDSELIRSVTQPMAEMAVLLAGYVSNEFPAVPGVVLLKDEGSPLADRRLFIIDHNGILRKEAEFTPGFETVLSDLKQLHAKWFSAW